MATCRFWCISWVRFVVHSWFWKLANFVRHSESGRVSANKSCRGPRWREFHCLAALFVTCRLFMVRLLLLVFLLGFRCHSWRSSCGSAVLCVLIVSLSHGAKHSYLQKICQPAESQVWRPCRASLVARQVSLILNHPSASDRSCAQRICSFWSN